MTQCRYCQDQHVCHVRDSHEDTVIKTNIMFYIGYRYAAVTKQLPLPFRVEDIQLPARHILALINQEKTLDEVLAEVDEEFGTPTV